MSVHEYASSLSGTLDDVELTAEPDDDDLEDDQLLMAVSWMAAGAMIALDVTILAAVVVVASSR